MKIYVLGDFGQDLYHIGRVRGMSAEVPIPVLTITRTAQLPAMAGNVLANLQALDMDAQALPQPSKPQPCPVKNRLVTESGVQLARWDVADKCPPLARADLVPLMNADAVIVADYGKGTVTPDIIEILRGVTLPVFVDTKQDPSPWIGAETAILFPNLAEYHQYEEQYRWIGRVLLKQGAAGMSYLEYGRVVLTCDAWADFVTCVNGAGDTVMAAFAAATLAGLPLQQVMQFAAAAAANVVEQPLLERTTSVDAVIERLETYVQDTQAIDTDEGNNTTLPVEQPTCMDGCLPPGNQQLRSLGSGSRFSECAVPRNPSNQGSTSPVAPVLGGQFFVLDVDGPVN